MLSNLLSSGGKMAVYCPQWVYAACVGLTARDFLVKDIPIDLMARRYSKALLENLIFSLSFLIPRLFLPVFGCGVNG